MFQKQAPPIPPKPKSRVVDEKFPKLAITTPKHDGAGDKHHHPKEKSGPTMRKKSMKKKKMTDEEILAALSAYTQCFMKFFGHFVRKRSHVKFWQGMLRCL